MTEIISTEDLHRKLPDQPTEHFCIAPFQSIRQNPYGRNSPCAFGAGDWHHGNLTPTERWNSPELNQLRSEFIKGNRPEACRRCWNEEDAGKQSLRQRQYEYFPDDYNDFLKSGKWLNGPKTAVFKVSNVCNLACRSCAGWDSNTYTNEGKHYLAEYNTTAEVQGERIAHNRFIPLLPPKHINFKDYFAIADNLKKIDFFGGEPFLNTTQLDLLEYLVEKDLSKDITLFYSTNCTNHPTERLKNAWKNFKRIEISMSIDGLGREFEYLRWPANWDESLEVINHIKSLRHQINAEIFLMGSLTFSVMNAFTVDPLVNWITENIGPYYVNMVQSPEYLSVHIVPDYIKEALLGHVKNQELKNYLQLRPSDSKLWRQFIIWMKRQDLYRKQNFSEIFPEYFELIKHDWEKISDLSERHFNAG